MSLFVIQFLQVIPKNSKIAQKRIFFDRSVGNVFISGTLTPLAIPRKSFAAATRCHLGISDRFVTQFPGAGKCDRLSTPFPL
jgi:hypothetical protein